MARRECDHCGAEVPPRATACPECGSDERTGWADEDDIHDALWAAPDEAEEYESVLEDLGTTPASDRSRRDLVLLVIAAITLVAFLLAVVL